MTKTYQKTFIFNFPIVNNIHTILKGKQNKVAPKCSCGTWSLITVAKQIHNTLEKETETRTRTLRKDKFRFIIVQKGQLGVFFYSYIC